MPGEIHFCSCSENFDELWIDGDAHDTDTGEICLRVSVHLPDATDYKMVCLSLDQWESLKGFAESIFRKVQ